VRHADLLDAPVAVWVRERDFEEVMEKFQAAGAAMAPIYDIGQLMHDPHIVERQTVISIEDEDLGALKMQNVFARLSGTPGSIRYAGRRKGRDTDEVFRELLGLDGGQVAALREQGII
jgi:crotonobetainyl-CoA:carnitine CoA-transferase CaiB-like acyl-CoA transferase